MKIFKASQVREIDQYTITNEPVESIDLMERAAIRLTAWYVRHFHVDQKVVLFAGPGNNGGDALAMARLLAERQYSVTCFLLAFGNLSGDSQINLERLKKQDLVQRFQLEDSSALPGLTDSDVIIDGIFGSGLSRPVSGFPARVIQYINEKASTVISIDIPSGLFGENNSENDYETVVRADYTLTFQFPFLSFFFASNEAYIGSWKVHDINLHPEIIKETGTAYETLETADICNMLPHRSRFAHKGTVGHGLIISGSYGMMGAALLAGEACLRGGAGLTTLHVPRSAYGIIQTGFPEALVSLDQSDILYSEPPDLSPYSAIGAGPGLGKKPNTGKGLKILLERIKVPLLIDADGLNILASNQSWLELLPENTILTPHPKEFDRLAGPSTDSYQRHLSQIDFARKYKVIVILKGAYTGLASPAGDYYFNTTGNPGMATGGSGDVLTGLITGLLAQGLNPLDAARAGVYLHGLAGDLALENSSEEALIAGDITRYLGAAFNKVRGE